MQSLYSSTVPSRLHLSSIYSDKSKLQTCMYQCAWNFACPAPIYWNFSKCFGVFKGKNTLFSKVLKNWSSCQKTDYHFLEGGEVRPQSDKISFFEPFPYRKRHPFPREKQFKTANTLSNDPFNNILNVLTILINVGLLFMGVKWIIPYYTW